MDQMIFSTLTIAALQGEQTSLTPPVTQPTTQMHLSEIINAGKKL
jgi:hypothetical protein